MVVSAAAALTSSVRVRGGLPLCGASFAQVDVDHQGRSTAFSRSAAERRSDADTSAHRFVAAGV